MITSVSTLARMHATKCLLIVFFSAHGDILTYNLTFYEMLIPYFLYLCYFCGSFIFAKYPGTLVCRRRSHDFSFYNYMYMQVWYN